MSMQKLYVVNQLEKLIEKTPIAVRDVLRVHDKEKKEINIVYGLTQRLPYRKLKMGKLIDNIGWSEYGVAISAYCDDAAKTLLHEMIHVYRAIEGIDNYNNKTQDEMETVIMTNIFWEMPYVRKMFQDKTVEVIGKFEDARN